MTKLYEGQLIDLFQNDLKYNPEVIAFSYALQIEKQRIMREVQTTRTMAVIDDLPEPILDVLAVELRTPYYRQDLTVERKREVVRNSLLWHHKAGTPAAVAELVTILFGTGKVVEWFNFTDGEIEPYTFDIETDTQITEEIAEDFLRIIQRVKNTRSHLRRLLVHREVHGTAYAAAHVIQTPKVVITNTLIAERMMNGAAYVAATMAAAGKVSILNSPVREAAIKSRTFGAAGMAATSVARIFNHPARAATIKGNAYGAAGMTAAVKIQIK